ncbi:hypothetical protein QLL95_gp0291 [Cotonvirus japonicus]|uniref:Uncharacterized protein n=1 Tax=Cotonvirus japonicus TaxID=2811091 RepID=A0ABM7NRJ6_9VIRU|nr:hypothetical protein QLL95_gp0291 [Cotonvirus japonicus]BCS82780.1 hypothetical protein [Cotonvirus japonicus]
MLDPIFIHHTKKYNCVVLDHLSKMTNTVNTEYIINDIVSINDYDFECRHCKREINSDTGLTKLTKMVESNSNCSRIINEIKIEPLISKSLKVLSESKKQLDSNLIGKLNWHIIVDNFCRLVRKCMFEILTLIVRFSWTKLPHHMASIYGPMIRDIFSGNTDYNLVTRISVDSHINFLNIVDLLCHSFDIEHKGSDIQWIRIHSKLTNPVFLEYLLSKKYVQDFLNQFDKCDWFYILNCMNQTYLDVEFHLCYSLKYYFNVDMFCLDINSLYIHQDLTNPIDFDNSFKTFFDKFFSNPHKFKCKYDNLFIISYYQSFLNRFDFDMCFINKKEFYIVDNSGRAINQDEFKLIKSSDKIFHEIEQMTDCGWKCFNCAL